MKIKKKQDLVKKWFIKLQNIICKNIELLEKEYGSNKKFKKNKWKYGEFRIIKGEVTIDCNKDINIPTRLSDDYIQENRATADQKSTNYT